MLGYKYLKNMTFENALGIGSAWGHEFLPIIDQIKTLIILEPSSKLQSDVLKNKPVKYVSPDVSGRMPFATDTFDLMTCFDVMHHIPNVSFVLSEMHRCLKPGGILLMREPINSMGNWNFPRGGLTKHERGIPFDIFKREIQKIDFEVMKETLCIFPVIPKILVKMDIKAYNFTLITYIDALICKMLSSRVKYHADNWVEKIRPTSVFYILRKK